MLFKSFMVFQITQCPAINIEKAQQALEAESAPLNISALEQLRWMSPFGYGHEALAHSIGDNILLCAERAQKVLPASILNQNVQETAATIAHAENRQVSKREMASIREQTYGQMLSKAFVKKTHIMAYLDLKQKRLILGTTNKALADTFLDLLFKTFNDLCLARLDPTLPGGIAMTGWLKNDDLPEPFTLAYDCEVVDLEEKQSKLKFKGMPLQDPDIISHLTPSRQVAKLSMMMDEKLMFTLNQDLSISGLKYLELLQTSRSEIATDTKASELDADFAIASDTINTLIDALVHALGGMQATTQPQTQALEAEVL